VVDLQAANATFRKALKRFLVIIVESITQAQALCVLTKSTGLHDPSNYELRGNVTNQ